MCSLGIFTSFGLHSLPCLKVDGTMLDLSLEKTADLIRPGSDLMLWLRHLFIRLVLDSITPSDLHVLHLSGVGKGGQETYCHLADVPVQVVILIVTVMSAASLVLSNLRLVMRLTRLGCCWVRSGSVARQPSTRDTVSW